MEPICVNPPKNILSIGYDDIDITITPDVDGVIIDECMFDKIVLPDNISYLVITATHYRGVYSYITWGIDVAYVDLSEYDGLETSEKYEKLDSTRHKLIPGTIPQSVTTLGLECITVDQVGQVPDTVVSLAIGEYYDYRCLPRNLETLKLYRLEQLSPTACSDNYSFITTGPYEEKYISEIVLPDTLRQLFVEKSLDYNWNNINIPDTLTFIQIRSSQRSDIQYIPDTSAVDFVIAGMNLPGEKLLMSMPRGIYYHDAYSIAVLFGSAKPSYISIHSVVKHPISGYIVKLIHTDYCDDILPIRATKYHKSANK